MRWYWAIDCDDTVENSFVAGVGDLMGVEDWELREGTPVSKWNPLAWIKASSIQDDGNPDDVLQTYLGVPVYSQRLQKALDKMGSTGIQYLPLHVRHHDGRELLGYAVANIINSVAALDVERSKYTRYGADWPIEERRGDVSSVIEPVLLHSVLNGHHIVRLKEYTPPVYVSQPFKDMFEASGFTGYSFREVAVTNDGKRADVVNFEPQRRARAKPS